jgi:hypothetical protein
MPGAPLYDIARRHGLKSADYVLDHWNLNKDYPGIDLTPLGISEKTRLRLLRLGIISKGIFVLFSGRFDWRRHFYRVRILLRSFFGKGNPRADVAGPILDAFVPTKVEG